MAEDHGGNEPEGGSLTVAEHLAKVIVVLLKVTETIVLGTQLAVLRKDTLVLALKLVERHEILAETSEGTLHGAAGACNRGEKPKQPGLQVRERGSL